MLRDVLRVLLAVLSQPDAASAVVVRAKKLVSELSAAAAAGKVPSEADIAATLEAFQREMVKRGLERRAKLRERFKK